MLIPIKRVIASILEIPGAKWDERNPATPPVLRARHVAEPVPMVRGPAFDDSGFTLPSSPRWNEAVNAVRRRLAPDNAGVVASGPVGADALAWYVSFHGHQDRWGIYVPLSSLPIMDELHLSHLPMPRAARWRLAWDVLLAHESVHFAVDWACAWFELLYHAPLCRAVHERMRAIRLGSSAILPHSSYFEAEEALANGHMLRVLGPRLEGDAAAALRRFVRVQPPGYRDGEVAEPDAGFAATTAEVLRGYLAVWSTAWNLDPGNPGLDLSRLLPLTDADLLACPVWVLDDLDAAGLPADAVRLFGRVAPIDETPAFLKRVRRRGLEDAWARTKVRLGEGIPNSSDFKKWPKAGEGMWSVRVTDGARAHLRQPARSPAASDRAEPWLACDIGGHKEMGHG